MLNYVEKKKQNKKYNNVYTADLSFVIGNYFNFFADFLWERIVKLANKRLRI